MFFKIIVSVVSVKGWIEDLRLKEASHIMTSVAAYSMLIFVSIPMLIIPAPTESEQLQLYVAVVFALDTLLLVSNCVAI
jgi:hypothetical protein